MRSVVERIQAALTMPGIAVRLERDSLDGGGVSAAADPGNRQRGKNRSG